jgi:dipeptidyl aminopeptidase/acylaminoacyl peptidase
MPSTRLLPLIVILTALTILPAQGRPLLPEDWYRFQTVSDLQISRDGQSVAYLVTSYYQQSDESRAALWLVGWNGGAARPLSGDANVSEPRFLPQGNQLSYLAAPSPGAPTQLWVVDGEGGKPRQLTQVKGELVGYEWSPDGRQAVLVMRGDTDSDKPRPLVIDALQFKADRDGYLTAQWRSHLYLLDASSGKVQPLTTDPARADSLPAFSPDGRQLAYVSNRYDTGPQLGVDELNLIAAKPGATPRLLRSTWSPNHQHLEWSPDGTQLAYLRGSEPKYNAYMMDELVMAEVGSGHLRVLTHQLDRAVLSPAFSGDGKSIQFAVEDDGYQYPAQVVLTSGAIERLGSSMVVEELAAAGGHTAVLSSSDHSAVEAYALERGALRPLSAHNRNLLAKIDWGTVEDISFKSSDGVEVHGQIVKPPNFVPGRRYPTILWIHGGPNGQDDHSLELAGYGPPLERQLFATHGYVVLAINYRGGTGRGEKYARAIVADWGHKEVEDLLAGTDYAIKRGIADPARLGVGGWSYGGLLTDYCIASDPRFKAAISGAGSGNQLSTYGSDEYLMQYNAEMGPPWRDRARWIKVSYPFFRAERIHTPTLFLGGDKDFNVPVGGGEQMYQALRTLGVPAELVVYPGEYHTLTRPSFLVDRFQRYLDWMSKYLASPETITADAGTPRARR